LSILINKKLKGNYENSNQVFNSDSVSAILGSLSAQQGQGRGGQRVQKTPEETARDQVEWMKNRP